MQRWVLWQLAVRQLELAGRRYRFKWQVTCFLYMACKGSHFTGGNKLPASKFSDPSLYTRPRGNVALFYRTLLADGHLRGVAVRANGS